MKFLKKAEECLNSKTVLLMLMLTLASLFKSVLLESYDSRIVIPYLSKAENRNLGLDIVLLLTSLFTVGIFVQHFRQNTKIKSENIFIAFVAVVIVSYYRFCSKRYIFYEFSISHSLKYIDYLFLFFLGLIIVKAKSLFSSIEPNYFQSSFIVDKPKTTSSEDLFDRVDFAKAIAVKIQSKTELGAGAVAIGINGTWGSGKTSFMNLIKEQLDYTNRIIIDFNPWRSISAAKIVEDFFELIIAKLKVYDSTLSRSIEDYANTLTDIDENKITKGLKVITDFFLDKADKNKNYEQINRSILRIRKQIIIFIDDLDRLDKKEIVEVLRIIRNTANFENVVYVASYDKGYVLEAVKEYNDYNHSSFLDKIFQFEFTLPLINVQTIFKLISKHLSGGLDKDYTSQVERAITSREFTNLNFTTEVIHTYRDVIRFTNSFLFDIANVKTDVFFYDFYLLQLLKIKFPKVYEALVEYRYLFFTMERRDIHKQVYRLRYLNEHWLNDDLKNILGDAVTGKNPATDTKSRRLILDMYLAENKNLSLSRHERDLIINLVQLLLTIKKSKDPNLNIGIYNSFIYPTNTYKYFSFVVDANAFRTIEFESLRKGDFSYYEEKIREWSDEKRLSHFLEKLEKIKDYTSIKEFENHVKALFTIGRILLQKRFRNVFDYMYLVDVLQYPQANVLYEKESDYHDFLRNWLNQSTEPIFDSYVISLLTERSKYVLPSGELTMIVLGHIESYLKINNEVTREFLVLFDYYIATNGGSVFTHHQDIDKNVVSFILEHLKSDQLSLFVVKKSDAYMLNMQLIRILFEKEDDFETYINKRHFARDAYYEEFKAFFNISKQNPKSSYKTEFKFLDVEFSSKFGFTR